MYVKKTLFSLTLCLTVVCIRLPVLQATATESPDSSGGDSEILITERLRASLLDDTRLRELRLLGVQRQQDGSLAVRGLLQNENQRMLVEELGMEVLSREISVGTLIGPFPDLDASGMEVLRDREPTAVDLLFAFEKMLPTEDYNVLRVGRYDPIQRYVRLCGLVRDHEVRARAQAVLLATGELDVVDVASVVVIDQPESERATAFVFTEALHALKRGRGDQVVAWSTHMLQRGRNRPLVWYLRASGHLLLGDRETGIADVRMAVALEGEGAYGRHSTRFHAFQSFQGPWRFELERLVAFGRTISLMPSPESPRL